MAEMRKQYKVGTVTSSTGITLVPVPGELGDNTDNMPATIELTYTASPTAYRHTNKVIEVALYEK